MMLCSRYYNSMYVRLTAIIEPLDLLGRIQRAEGIRPTAGEEH